MVVVAKGFLLNIGLPTLEICCDQQEEEGWGIVLIHDSNVREENCDPCWRFSLLEIA